MASVNSVHILGNLGKDPEVRHLESGQVVCNFSMACNEKWRDKASGQTKERVEWVRVVVWGAQASACGEYLAKGRQAYVEGRLQTRKYTDKDGNERSITEVVARSVVFLGGKPAAEGQAKSSPTDGDYDYGPPPRSDDDVPF